MFILNKKVIFSVLLSFFILLISNAKSLENNIKNNDLAYKTALALNYAHASLYTITDFSDRIVLDQEYRNILSNINLSNIEDQEIIELLQRLLDTLSHFILDEKELKIIESVYMNKIENSFYSDIKNISSHVLMSVATNPLSMYSLGFSLILNVGDQAFNYRDNIDSYRTIIDNEIWKLEREQENRLTNLRKQFLSHYWILMRRHGIPDDWRISEDQFSNYLDILKDHDNARKYRRLERIKGEFHAYPPFWYHLGRTAQQLDLLHEARSAYDFFLENHIDYLRDDSILTSVLLNRIQLYDIIENRNQIKELLEKAFSSGHKDGRSRLAIALYYANMMEYEKATNLLQYNIDEEFMIPLNLRILAEVNSHESYQSDNELYKNTVLQMIANENVSIDNIIYLIGLSNNKEIINYLYDIIKDINIDYSSGYINDDIVLTIPKKWFLNDEINLNQSLFIEFINGIIEPYKKETDDENDKYILSYRGFLDLKDFPEQDFPFEARLNLPSRITPIILVFRFYHVDKIVDNPNAIQRIGRFTGILSDAITQKIPVFEHYKLETPDNCYKVEENYLSVGCISSLNVEINVVDDNLIEEWKIRFNNAVNLYSKGDYYQAYIQWLKLAEEGHVYSRFAVGLLYERGDGVERNNKKAFEWYYSAAEKGHAHAKYALGEMYKYGLIVSIDESEAQKWFDLAAEQGVPDIVSPVRDPKALILEN